MINMVKKVSDDIKMEFGLDKGSKATLKKGNKVPRQRIQVIDDSVILETAVRRPIHFLT